MSNSQHIRGTNPILTTYASCVVHTIPNNGLYNCLVKEQHLTISKYSIRHTQVPNMYLRSKDIKIIPLSSITYDSDP